MSEGGRTMKKRLLAALAVCCLFFSLSACRLRVDLTKDPFAEENPHNAITDSDETDEMAESAWQIYEKAVEAEEEMDSYTLSYEGRRTMLGQTAITRATVTRLDGEQAEILVKIESGSKQSSGYFANGIGYFHVENEKYWMPTDEESFWEEMGFSESPKLKQEMFAEAIVMDNEDGTKTVSCPLYGQYATDYAILMLGDTAKSGTVSRAEEGLTVDSSGRPVVFTSKVTVSTKLYGEMRYERQNRYDAVGADVTLTPPDDLDSYSLFTE